MQKGQYIVATKYADGDPLDQFCVGFWGGFTNHKPVRYIVLDAEGQPFRGNGFRRVKKITAEIGEMILQNTSKIESSGVSVWNWVRKFEEEFNQ